MSASKPPPFFADGMPQPRFDLHTRPFWDACREHRLLIQRCSECGAHRSPPKALCADCGSFAYDWTESQGLGRVFTYAIAHHCPHPVASASLPYNIAVIELDDCDRALLISNVIDCREDLLRVGLPVQLVWEDRSDGQTLYRFRPRSA